MGKIIFYCYNKRYIILIAFFVLSKLSCFATELIENITAITFEPLQKDETIDYFLSETETNAMYEVEPRYGGSGACLVKKHDGNIIEKILIFRSKTIRKNNNKIYFSYDMEKNQENSQYDGESLYMIDGEKGTIINLKIPLCSFIGSPFKISSNGMYLCYAFTEPPTLSETGQRENFLGYIPCLGVLNLATSDKIIFSFSKYFLQWGYSIAEINIDYRDNRFYIEFISGDNAFSSWDGYIELDGMCFYLTLGNPEAYINPPLNLANFHKTHIASNNLRLRYYPKIETAYDNSVYTIPKGSYVQLLRNQNMVTIDGISAPWVKVLTEDGHTGWCFSGYLEPVDLAKE